MPAPAKSKSKVAPASDPVPVEPPVAGGSSQSTSSRPALPIVILILFILGISMAGAIFLINKSKLKKPEILPSPSPFVSLEIKGIGLVQEIDNKNALVTIKEAATDKIFTLKLGAETKFSTPEGGKASFGDIKKGSLVTFSGDKESADSANINCEEILIQKAKDVLPGTG